MDVKPNTKGSKEKTINIKDNVSTLKVDKTANKSEPTRKYEKITYSNVRGGFGTYDGRKERFYMPNIDGGFDEI